MRSVHAISISFNNVTKISHLVSHDRARKFPRATKQPNGPLVLGVSNGTYLNNTWDDLRGCMTAPATSGQDDQ